MDMPSVVIVGRPNVGKSSLFNAMYGGRVAIVEPTAGVTRDRISRIVERGDAAFELWDTGGMGLQDSEELADDIEQQIRFAIDSADLVLFVLDAKTCVQPLDKAIALELREAGKNVRVVVNKCDNRSDDLNIADFYSLGFDGLFPVSAARRRNTGDLVADVIARLPQTGGAARPAADGSPRPEPMKIAFVGRRNVGKSTIVNWLAKEPRVLVSELPGTTRDAVDVRFRMEGLEFIAIDTAGLRRPKQIKDSIDFYSSTRAEESIKRADVVVHVMDAPTEVSRLDKQLADHVTAQYKPCVLAINKMDLATGVTCEQFQEYVRAMLPGVAYAPIVCVSGMTGQNVLGAIEAAQALYEQSLCRVKTSTLWRVVEEATTRNRPPSSPSRSSRITYATQVGVQPPKIILFAANPDLITENYLRYLANQLRRALPYSAIPLKLIVRPKQRGREHE